MAFIIGHPADMVAPYYRELVRNKTCVECPQNEREDTVWNKGFTDGVEAGVSCYRRLFWKIYYKKW